MVCIHNDYIEGCRRFVWVAVRKMFSVLYVDDEPDLLDIARMFLEQSGEFRVATSTSASETITSLQSPPLPYDAIISDYQMPGMDGITFLKAIRERFGDIPFILFTGRGREEVVIEAINHGVDFYLQKGGDPHAQFAELGHKVSQAIRRRKAEQELRRSEDRYRSVVNDQTEMITRFTPDGTITFANEAYRTAFLPLMGLGDVIGRKIRDIMQVQNYDEVGRFLGSLTPEMPVRDMERVITGNDGKAYWQKWTVRAIFDGDRGVVEYQVVGRDITGEKKAEAALRESESRLRSLVEATSDSVSLIDEEGRVIEWNPASERISGIRKEDAIGTYIWDLTFSMLPKEKRREEYRRVLEDKIKNSLRTGIPVFLQPVIVEAMHPDGTLFISRQTIFPIRTSKGYMFGSLAHDITEEKKAENALRENEKKYRDLAELLPQAMFELDPRFMITYANRHAFSLFGYTEEDLGKGISALALIDPSQHATVRWNAQRQVEGLPTEPQVYTGVKKDGTVFPLVIYSSAVFRDNVLAGFRGIIVDITARKKLEDELRESKERFRGMAERSVDLIFIIGRDMSPTYVSPSSRDIIGYEPGELVGKPSGFAVATIFSRSGPEIMEAVRKNMEGMAVSNTEVSLVRKDGTMVQVSVSSVPVMRNGVFSGVQVTMRDISRMKAVEDEVKQNRKQLAEAMDLANLVNWEYNVSTGLFTFDDRFYALYGTSAGHEGGTRMTAGTYAREFVHPDDRHVVAEEAQKAVETTDPQYVSYLDHRIVRRDGEVRYITVRIAIEKDGEGRTVRIHGANQDITERKRAEEALRLANRQLNLLSDITSHDILNKVMIIQGLADYAGMKSSDPDLAVTLGKIGDAAREIQAQAGFTKVYRDLGSQAPAWVDVEAVISRLEAPGGVTLDVRCPGLEILADRMIERVFFNLLDNAVRHGKKVTRIAVSCRERDNDLVVTWEDNGAGIHPANKERVFERGFGDNTGLGMFLVREVLNLTAMTITETGEYGKGARFEIRVPRGMYRIRT
jgi:PAS domain S-box-containing protein